MKSDLDGTKTDLDAKITAARSTTRVSAETAIQALIKRLATLASDSENIPQVVSAADTIIKLKEHMDLDSGA